MDIKERIRQEKRKYIDYSNVGYNASVDGWNDAIDYILEEYGDELELRWIRVEDELPEKSGITICLVKSTDEPVVPLWYDAQTGWWEFDTITKRPNVVCWMPLPEPPGEDK